MKTLQTKMQRPAAQKSLQFIEDNNFSENQSSDENDEGNAVKLPLEVQLIKHIAREQALYNPKHEFYRNSVRKDEKWLKIGEAIGWSEAQCKAKWKAFRDQYCRELKRSKKNSKATVKWKYFKYLEFLRPFALSRNYRPRFITPATNASNTMSTTAGAANNNNDYKHGNVDAALIGSDFSLLSSIKLEPQTQQDEQQPFLDNCTATLTTTTMNNAATTQHNIKNETIVVIAAEQFQQHLNNVYQQPVSQQQQQQQQHIESWSFLTSTTTTTANSLLNHQQQSTQQQISNENGHNQFNYIHQASNSSSTADADACLYNAFDNYVAAAAEANVNTNHESVSQKTEQQQQTALQQKSLPIFLPPPPLLQAATSNNTMTSINSSTNHNNLTSAATSSTINTTSSDEEDGDSIHTFLNIESYFEKELIANVQSEDILYNNFHPNYRNVKLKLDVWADIARKMKKTVKQCRLKWKALRDQYIREHKRLRNRENIESVPRWKHYDALNFLHKFIKHKSETEEKQIYHIPKTEIELGEELMMSVESGSATDLMPPTHATEQQKLQLQATLIELNDAHDDRRLKEVLKAIDPTIESDCAERSRDSGRNSDAKLTTTNYTTVTTTTTAMPTNATTTAATLVAINDSHDDDQHVQHDDYDAMDIDEYIITEAGGNNCVADDDDIVEQQQQQHKINAELVHDDDEHVVGVEGEGVDDDDDDEEDCMLSAEDCKAMNQLQQSYADDDCILEDENEDEVTQQLQLQQEQQQQATLDEEFQNLKHMVNMPLQNEEQQQQQQQQHPTATANTATQQQDESLMQVVGLGDVDDELVVINNASVAQLGFVVTTTTATTTPASVGMQHNQQEQQQQLQQHPQQQTNFVSISKTSPNVRESLDFYSNHHNKNFSLNSSSHSHSHTHNNNTNNNHNTNFAAATHDVNSVLSAIASCADFSVNYNQTITTQTTSAPAAATSFTPASSSSVTHNSSNVSAVAPLPPPLPPTVATSTTTPSTITNTLTSSTAVTNLSPNISNAVSCAAPIAAVPYANTNSSIASSSLNSSSAVDDDEVGTFFHSITMKVRSLNLSPIEFTDLQIEVLRVINRSIRKN